MSFRETDPTLVERDLRELVQGVGLVGELDLSPLSRTFQLARNNLRQLLADGSSCTRIAGRYPATVVIYLVAEGVYKYNHGAYWPLLEVQGLDPTEMGKGFLLALSELRLEPYEYIKPEGAYRWITPILLHGGIPHFCAKDVLKLLVSEMRQGSADATEMVSRWIQSPTRMFAVDRPVQRFLTHGGEQAIDLVERLITMVFEYSAGRSPDADELALPAYLVGEFVKLSDETRRVYNVGAGLPTPSVAFDFTSGSGPELLLPQVSKVHPVSHWIVSGGRPQRFPVSTYSETVVPLTEAGSWQVELMGDRGVDRSTTFRGASGTRVFFFDASTRKLLRNQDRLAVDSVVALAPTGFGFRNGGYDGEPVALVELLPPLDGQWRWYEAHHLDLRKVTTMWIGDSSPMPGVPSTAAMVRVSGPSQRPTLYGTECVGLTGVDGRTVYTASPRLAVPGGARAGWHRWRLKATINGEPIMHPLSELPSAGDEILLDGVIRDGQVAEAELDVIGPLGSDLRNVRFLVVPGLEVELPSQVLRPDERVDVVLIAAPGIRLGDAGESTAVVTLPSGDDTARLSASDGAQTVDLLLTVPRLAWVLRRGRQDVQALSSQVGVFTAEELSNEDALLIRTRRRARLTLELGSGSEILQELPWVDTVGADGRWAFGLVPFLDTIRRGDRSRVRLQIRLGGHAVLVAEVITTYVATIVSAQSLVDHADGSAMISLTFNENRSFKNRQAWLWSLDRPWEGACVLPIDDDAFGAEGVVLETLAPPGRYLVEIGLGDGWTSPKRPKRHALHVAEIGIGGIGDIRRYLRSLDQSDPAVRFQTALAEPSDGYSISPEDAVIVAPKAILAVLALLEESGSQALSDRRFDVVTKVLCMPQGLAAGVRELVDDGELGSEGIMVLTIALLPDLLNQLVIQDELIAHQLHRSDHLLAAVLDPAFVDDAAAGARWAEYLGWHPDDPENAYPFKGGEVTEQWLRLTTDRLRQVELSLDLNDRKPLAAGGFISAMFEWLIALQIESSGDTSRWIERYRVLNDRRPPHLSTMHEAFLEALKPQGLGLPSVTRFPYDLLAAAMQLVSIPNSRLKATAALLEAATFAPKLVERNLLTAIVLHRG